MTPLCTAQVAAGLAAAQEAAIIELQLAAGISGGGVGTSTPKPLRVRHVGRCSQRTSIEIVHFCACVDRLARACPPGHCSPWSVVPSPSNTCLAHLAVAHLWYSSTAVHTSTRLHFSLRHRVASPTVFSSLQAYQTRHLQRSQPPPPIATVPRPARQRPVAAAPPVSHPPPAVTGACRWHALPELPPWRRR